MAWRDVRLGVSGKGWGCGRGVGRWGGYGGFTDTEILVEMRRLENKV